MPVYFFSTFVSGFLTFLRMVTFKSKNVNIMSKIKFISVLLGLFCMSLFSVRSQQFLPTNYDEPFRGQFHFSQQSGWMNDVNGIWYQDGIYHLTYQSYPYYLDGNPKYWGHATSPDMIHWTQLPTVLNPFGEPDGNVPGACWSGSTVIDFNNTSGFGTAENPPLVTIYTATSRGTCLAYSLDKGATWTPYSDNPVNVAGPNEETRDPHVLWHQPTQKWVCVIFENGFTFYTSPDLKNWTKTDNINWGYECPDFFELPVDGGAAAKWVLLQADGQYFTGDFDGADFTPDAGGPYITTHNYGFGGGFYASQTFFQHNFPGNRTVQMAWMLGMGTGSTAPWTHNASFPCELALKTFPEGIRLTRNPVSEITTLYKNTQTWTNQVLCSNKNLFTNKLAKCFDMEVVLDVSDATADLVMFQIANKIINYDITNETLYGKSLKPVNNQVKIRFLVDWGELEIFGNDGQYSYVENFRFTPGDHSISMIANGDINLVSARFSELDRIWDNTANNAYADDSDPAAVYSGAWATGINESGYYNYDCHIATAAGSSVEYTFKGKQISWYGLKNNDLGKASVYIDGVLAKADIDCYSTTRVVQQLFTKTDLPDESHTIKVVATGTKNPASSGIALVHDYFGFLRAPQAEAPATDLQHFIMYGQSLSTGHEAYPVSISTIPGNYMIGEQIWINYGNINLEQLNP
jgi:sucrose-6-phosphate hydrolase SacC (GH32 family)